MHRNLNSSFEDSTRLSPHAKRDHKNPRLSHGRTDKENLRRSFESSGAHPKNNLPHSHTFAANSPSYANPKEHTEEMNMIPVNNLINSLPKKPLELRDNSQNRLNTSHHKINYEENFERRDDSQYGNNELLSLRKALNEAQLKNTALSKDLSKFQHESSMLHLQIRRNEIRIGELTESRASDQIKIAELASQKSQLANEVNKLRIESHDSTHKTKENVDNLRKNLADVEAVIQRKHKNMTRCAKHLRHAMHALQNLLYDMEMNKSPACQNLMDKIQEIVERMLHIATANNSTEENLDHEENLDSGMSRSVKSMMDKYELENNELKDHIGYLEGLLQKERFKTKTLLPQYRETVDKLKRTAYGMKEKLQESQNQRKEERTKFTHDYQEVKKANKSLAEEIKELKTINVELNGRTRQYETLVTQNEEKVQKLIQDHQRLEQLVHIMKKNEEAQKNKENSEEHYRKKPRASSKDLHRSSNKIAIETDTEDTSATRSSLPRSSSASRSKHVHSRDPQSLRSRDGNLEFTFENSEKFSQTLNQAKRRSSSKHSSKNALNKSIDVDRLRSSTVSKSFWVENSSSITPNDNAELMARCFTLQKSRCDESVNQPCPIEQQKNGGPRGFFGSQLEGFQESESMQRESEQETSFNDIKDEIASLENEIGEIDNYMKDQMNTVNSTYIIDN